MMKSISVLVIVILVGWVGGKSVPVYYLNADYDYRNMKDWARPDIDCVHTVGDTIPFPEKITVCVRMMHITYENPVVSSYATAFAFGTLLDDWSELREGRNKEIITLLIFTRSLFRIPVWRMGDWSLVGLQN